MTPKGRAIELEASDGKHGEAQVNLLEQILSRENMLLAWKRVKANKGAAGMDAMSIEVFPEFARHHWERIRSALMEGTYLHAGVILPDGSREATRCGVPQGGPLSPLLANIMLDDLDKELEARGLRFARYADDFLIFVRSRSAAQRVLRTVARFIESRLALAVNWTKSQAARLRHCSFLGFAMRQGKLHWTDAAVQRFKQRVREITNRSNGQSMRSRIQALRRYVIGWMNYFGHSRSYSQLLELDQWLRRRVRLGYWKQWKRPRTRRRHLLALGIAKDEVKLATRSRKGYWRMAGNSIVQRALTKQWLWDQGVPNMRQQWVDLHYPDGPASLG